MELNFFLFLTLVIRACDLQLAELLTAGRGLASVTAALAVDWLQLLLAVEWVQSLLAMEWVQLLPCWQWNGFSYYWQ